MPEQQLDNSKAYRWFLVIKKGNGDVVFASRSTLASATQAKLFQDLELTPQDAVLELFQNPTLTPGEFEAYCREAYKNILPKKEPPPGAKSDVKDKKTNPRYKINARPPFREAHAAPVRSSGPDGVQGRRSGR